MHPLRYKNFSFALKIVGYTLVALRRTRIFALQTTVVACRDGHIWYYQMARICDQTAPPQERTSRPGRGQVPQTIHPHAIRPSAGRSSIPTGREAGLHLGRGAW